MTKTSRTHYALVCASWLFVALLSLRTPQGMNSDSGWGLKATLQFVFETSPSIGHLVAPLSSDMSRSAASWVFWWPAGTQLAVYPLLRLGLSLGAALRCIVLGALLFGALGWMRWILRFRLPRAWSLAIAIALPWHHYAANVLAVYTAEIFVFAFTPWILCAVLDIGEDWSRATRVSVARCVFVGLFMGSAYLFKYTGIFIAVGACAYLCFEAWTRRADEVNRTAVVVGLGALGLACAAVVIAQNALNAHLAGAMNPIASTPDLSLKWTDIPFALAYPVMAAADADSLWSFVLLHPSHGLSQRWFGSSFIIDAGTFWTLPLGLPGGLWLLWAVLRQRAQGAARLAKTCLLSGIFVVLCLYVVSRAELYQARYLFSSAMAVLPWAIELGLATARRGRAAALAMSCLAAFYVALPLAYGVVSVVGKSRRTLHYVYGASGVYNPLLSATDIPATLSTVLRGTSQDDVWYLTDPISALDFRGRMIIRHADFVPSDGLRECFASSRSTNVHVLLPAKVDSDGKGSIIRGDFVGAGRWTKVEVADQLARWDARLAPGTCPAR